MTASRLAAVGEPNAADLPHLERTLVLARRGLGRVAPNPLVGCVLVRDGFVLAEGWHRRVGQAHAEVDALRQLGRDGARGATAYVNLEPCSHHGRTGPCVEALIDAGIERVVCCLPDPNPRVAGAGFDRLLASGIEVALGGPVADAIRLNLHFLVPRLLGRPAVSLKWASSLDGRIATRTGHSQWISSPEGRRWALGLREHHDAILVGSETAVLDDPRLTRREGVAEGPIVRVILDRRLRLRPEAAVFREPGQVLIYTLPVDQPSSDGQLVDAEERRTAASTLRSAGADVVEVDVVDPVTVLADLAARGVDSVLVEGGGEIHEAFRSQGCFDQVMICLAPLLIGGRSAAPAVGGLGAMSLDEASRLESLEVERAGPDLIVAGTARGRLGELEEALHGVLRGVPRGGRG